jgi:hypothetical protein
MKFNKTFFSYHTKVVRPGTIRRLVSAGIKVTVSGSVNAQTQYATVKESAAIRVVQVDATTISWISARFARSSWSALWTISHVVIDVLIILMR